jgi:hypothetical protein
VKLIEKFGVAIKPENNFETLYLCHLSTDFDGFDVPNLP